MENITYRQDKDNYYDGKFMKENPNIFNSADVDTKNHQFRNHDPNDCIYCFNELSIELQNELNEITNEEEINKRFEQIRTTIYAGKCDEFGIKEYDHQQHCKNLRDLKCIIEKNETIKKHPKLLESLPNLSLLESPKYAFSESSIRSAQNLSDEDMSDEDIHKFLQMDVDSSNSPILMNYDDSHMDTSTDSDNDDCILPNEEDEFEPTKCSGLNDESPYNILMNHPFFNRNNPHYNTAIKYHQMLTGQSSKSINKMLIRQKMVDVPMLTPERITISAAADTGSQIQAMGHNMSVYYKNKGLLKTDKKGIIIGTGNGKIRATKYLPAAVQGIDGKP